MDDADYDFLMQWSWHAHANKVGIWYARRQQNIAMHRVLCPAPKGCEVDHINHNGLDNRRENLRVTTKSQNKYNCRVYKNNTTGITGVSRMKRNQPKPFHAAIQKDRKMYCLGYHATIEEAVAARRAGELKHWGDFRKHGQ